MPTRNNTSNKNGNNTAIINTVNGSTKVITGLNSAPSNPGNKNNGNLNNGNGSNGNNGNTTTIYVPVGNYIPPGYTTPNGTLLSNLPVSSNSNG